MEQVPILIDFLFVLMSKNYGIKLMKMWDIGLLAWNGPCRDYRRLHTFLIVSSSSSSCSFGRVCYTIPCHNYCHYLDEPETMRLLSNASLDECQIRTKVFYNQIMILGHRQANFCPSHLDKYFSRLIYILPNLNFRFSNTNSSAL